MAVIISASILTGCLKEDVPADDDTQPSVSDSNPEDNTDDETDINSDTNNGGESSTADSTEKETDTTDSGTENTIPSTDPKNINPLTGLEMQKDYSTIRPVAIMINNLKIACPQMGVSKADIMYECLVEGGLTRLMMVVSDYENLPVVGSVRSSRDYYLDFAQNHDAIYFHAGGSPQAYSEIKSRSINNVDGVNMYTPSTFYRDAVRLKTMGYEHSVMTTGEGVVSALNYLKYRTEIKDSFVNPFQFLSAGEKNNFTGDAPHVHIPYSGTSIADFVYDESTGEYLRYQFNGVKHIDGETNEQLSFKNIIMIFNPTKAIPGDTSGRLEVTTSGTGDGYYISDGKYISIKWEKKTRDAPISFSNIDGTQLKLNRGTTFVSIISTSVKNNVSFNYSW